MVKRPATVQNGSPVDVSLYPSRTSGQHRIGEQGSRLLAAREFDNLLNVAMVRAYLSGGVVALLLVDTVPADEESYQSILSQLSVALESHDQLGERVEGGLQAILFDATREKVDRIAGLMVLRCGRSVRMGLAFLPSDAFSSATAGDMARMGQRMATSTHPLGHVPRESYRPPERRVLFSSEAMASVTRAIDGCAWTGSPILLCGEAGSGKEALGRTIHQWGSMQDTPFLSLNCNAVPAALIREVFHRVLVGGGVTSGAPGVGVAHHVGTLFLKRVEGLTPELQSTLALLLSQHGGMGQHGAPRSVGLRVVASSSEDLEARCQQGRFHPELLRLLSAAKIVVPPLRERREDIAGIAQHFLDDISARLGRGPLVLTGQAMRRLLDYSYPGNLPELRYELNWGANNTQAVELDVDCFSDTIRSSASDGAAGDIREQEFHGFDLRRRVQVFEAQLIVRALDLCDWNQTEACRLLNIPRRTLVYKMRQLGIRKPRTPKR